jgi:hypothetical protein
MEFRHFAGPLKGRELMGHTANIIRLTATGFATVCALRSARRPGASPSGSPRPRSWPPSEANRGEHD